MAAIEHRYVVEAEKPSFKNVITFVVHFVDPPGEIDEQLMKALFEKLAVWSAGANPIHVVNTPYCPRVKWRIQIGELPLVGGNLAIRVLKLLEQQEPQLFL